MCCWAEARIKKIENKRIVTWYLTISQQQGLHWWPWDQSAPTWDLCHQTWVIIIHSEDRNQKILFPLLITLNLTVFAPVSGVSWVDVFTFYSVTIIGDTREPLIRHLLQPTVFTSESVVEMSQDNLHQNCSTLLCRQLVWISNERSVDSNNELTWDCLHTCVVYTCLGMREREGW